MSIKFVGKLRSRLLASSLNRVQTSGCSAQSLRAVSESEVNDTVVIDVNGPSSSLPAFNRLAMMGFSAGGVSRLAAGVDDDDVISIEFPYTTTLLGVTMSVRYALGVNIEVFDTVGNSMFIDTVIHCPRGNASF